MPMTEAEEDAFKLLDKAGRMNHKREHRAARQVNIEHESLKSELSKKFVGFYKFMHQSPKRFLGLTTQHHAKEISLLVVKHEAKTLLDYGSGKGMQYLNLRVHEQWGGILPYCYDPGVFGIHKKPRERVISDSPDHLAIFDGVICCDVMEHIPEQLIPDTVEEIMSMASKFAYVNVALSPAGKNLPNGENAHVTLKPKEWWVDQFSQHINGKELILSFSSKDDDDETM